MGKINKKELNEKRAWVVTSIGHEGYTLDVDTVIFKNMSLLDVLDSFGFYGLENKLEKHEFDYPEDTYYTLDEVYHEDRDSDTWCLTEEEKDRFTPIHIGALMVQSLENFLFSQRVSGCFGDTNRKYGLMDYAKKPVEMEEEKDEKNNPNY
jgi:hypothetical protein